MFLMGLENFRLMVRKAFLEEVASPQTGGMVRGVGGSVGTGTGPLACLILVFC